jgi:hypothetical protein
MGMPMPGMGLPMGMAMPLTMPIPGVTPGMPGMGAYNSLPGRFGRDMLGRGEHHGCRRRADGRLCWSRRSWFESAVPSA